MALRKLYNLSTGSMNPSSLTNILPGGAGSITAGTTTNPGISAPRLEEWATEVLDVTAATLINSNGSTPATPAAIGKLLVMDWYTGAFGARWKQNSIIKQAIPGGQYGIVITAGVNTVGANGSIDGSLATINGNEAISGSKAVVITDGPCQALVNSLVQNTAISAGMQLAADGAGNLTYAGASPNAGTALATYMDGILSSGVSIPALKNIYVGGF